MPPAVAQAPIVTSTCEAARTSLIRSASSAVVIEPSTSETSYGPATVALEASRKCAISTRSASARSSSSTSRRLNWQPSHELNFHTASVGRDSASVGRDSISELPYRKPAGDLIPCEDRAVPADQHGPELAVATVTDAAAHVALERDVHTVRRHT